MFARQHSIDGVQGHAQEQPDRDERKPCCISAPRQKSPKYDRDERGGDCNLIGGYTACGKSHDQRPQ